MTNSETISRPKAFFFFFHYYQSQHSFIAIKKLCVKLQKIQYLKLLNKYNSGALCSRNLHNGQLNAALVCQHEK